MKTCLNLPPWVRVKHRNILTVGFVPGPKNSVDLDSFLFPLIQEFCKLENPGVECYNAAQKESFILHAHIYMVGSDMIGREKVMATMGNPAGCYCEYCHIRSFWNKLVHVLNYLCQSV